MFYFLKKLFFSVWIFCSTMLNAKTPEFIKMNFLTITVTNLLCFFELFTWLIHSQFVWCHTFRLDMKLFFSWTVGWKKSECVYSEICHSGVRKPHQEKIANLFKPRRFQFFVLIINHWHAAFGYCISSNKCPGIY